MKRPLVCPTVLAFTENGYREQLNRVVSFAHRVQIDLSDGNFAPTKTVSAEEVEWPVGLIVDIHLMYDHPVDAIKTLLPHKPNLIITHAEADGDFQEIVQLCKENDIKVGVALLKETEASMLVPAIEQIDHVLIFSGDLGKYGGRADLSLLDKARFLKNLKPSLEIGWDGGINDENIVEIAKGGVDVLNVGGFIQKSHEPESAFRILHSMLNAL